ncbi:alpha-N-acetylglucosaminidase [Cylas formicarius]|uniref:alpha-N-acetylglucosaminidase n=1 Tax=Cylas formicarius TaxID=197179 RepID=UPI002958DF61|nr:alpha-N-acetylglucosaminidase [Cylas formicarius]
MLASTLLWLFVLVIGIRCRDFESTLGHIRTSTSVEEQKRAVEDLLVRLIPERATDFVISIDPALSQDNKDAFTLQKVGGTVQVNGSTGVAAASGVHHYLKYFCGCHVSWEESQLNLPAELPDVDVLIRFNDRFRYYQNVCTTSYSFVWWSWEQWERHIDWIALNSFNLVLAFHGQEAIWERVYSKLGLTASDIEEHFTGPAFLSWLRMGNVRGWAAPLSSAWHQRSLALQKNILNRMRQLGITPVLPAFAGHLPRAFKRIYPNATMTKMDVWNDFNDTYCCPYFLDPTEDLFKTVGVAFIREQIAEYGTDHVYNCDSFNEVDPPTTDLSYLADVGRSIYAAMTDADSEAIWVMQGWLFYSSDYWDDTDKVKSFVTSVPTGKMIILDLQSEQFPQYDRLDQYFGQPYVWCMLHNFGGTLGMYGSATIINEEVIKARNAANSTMIGTGLTMEGINQNYVIYDLMSESAWRRQPTNLTEWFIDYGARRYGKSDPSLEYAWNILKDSVYDFKGIEKIRGQYAITKTPSLNISPWSWYNYSALFDAWHSFLSASDNLNHSSAYLHDLVDLTRQVLQVNGDIYYVKLIDAFQSKNFEDFRNTAIIFDGIFRDLEMILASDRAFLLGPWLESAKQCANSSEEEERLEYNARNQITLWGPNGEIMNYAIKQWSGIVADFLHPRWGLFVEAMNASLIDNEQFDEKNATLRMFQEVEEPFTFSRKKYPVDPAGSPVEIARKIADKYWYTSVDVIPEAKNLPMKKRKGLLRRLKKLKTFS